MVVENRTNNFHSDSVPLSYADVGLYIAHKRCISKKAINILCIMPIDTDVRLCYNEISTQGLRVLKMKMATLQSHHLQVGNKDGEPAAYIPQC